MSEKKHRKVKRRGRRKPSRFMTWFKQLSVKKRIALGVALVLLLSIVAGVIFVNSKFKKLNTETIEPEEIVVNELAEEVGKGYTNVVLFGGDSRTGELETGVRSDAIIIVSLNNETKEVKMVSVYRDTLLDVTDGSLRKCNSAYSLGGPKQAINMLNMNLDLNIQKYVTVDFGAVSEVVDLLGGIEVDVSDAEMRATNKYIAETARVAGKTANYLTHSGLQTLDGAQATTYARIRKGVGDDYQRTARQRLVIEKVVEKAVKSDLATINSIIDKVFPTISTNFTMSEILSYAKDFLKYSIGESEGFPMEKTSATLSGKGSCVIPVTLSENVTLLHEFLYGTVDYQPSATVQSISGQIQATVGAVTADPKVSYTGGSSGSDTTDTDTDTSQDKTSNKDKDTSNKKDTSSDEKDKDDTTDSNNNNNTSTDTGNDNSTNTGTGSGNSNTGNTDTGSSDSGNSGDTGTGSGDSGNTGTGSGDNGSTGTGSGDSGNTGTGSGDSGNTGTGSGDGGNTDNGSGDGGNAGNGSGEGDSGNTGTGSGDGSNSGSGEGGNTGGGDSTNPDTGNGDTGTNPTDADS